MNTPAKIKPCLFFNFNAEEAIARVPPRATDRGHQVIVDNGSRRRPRQPGKSTPVPRTGALVATADVHGERRGARATRPVRSHDTRH